LSTPIDEPASDAINGVFGLALEHCRNCGGELKINAAILKQPVIEKILAQLGLLARAPRSPPRVTSPTDHRGRIHGSQRATVDAEVRDQGIECRV